MTMQQHSATTALVAAPSAQADAGVPFTTVQRGGYHKGEVEDFVRRAREEIARLTRAAEQAGGRALSLLGHEAATPGGQKLISELLQIAADEITGQQAAAAAEVEQMIAGARQQAEQILADARRNADKTLSGASQQASTLVEQARVEAKKLTDGAAAKSAAVDEAAGQRLAHYTRLHEETIDRLRQVVDVVGAHLKANDERGPLGDEVDKALAAVKH